LEATGGNLLAIPAGVFSAKTHRFFSGTGRKIATVAPMTGAHRRVARQTSSASAERVGMLATEGIENQVAEPIGRGPIDKLDDLVVGRLPLGSRRGWPSRSSCFCESMATQNLPIGADHSASGR